MAEDQDKPAEKSPEKPRGKHGGPRPNSGRPPLGSKGKTKAKRPRSAKPAKAARIPLAPTEQTNMARKFARLAMASLANTAKNGTSETARNHAAELLLQWGYGKPLGIGDATMRPAADRPVKEPKLGKKEQLVRAAKNPDTSTAMGELMMQRAAQAKLNS